MNEVRLDGVVERLWKGHGRVALVAGELDELVDVGRGEGIVKGFVDGALGDRTYAVDAPVLLTLITKDRPGLLG